MLPPDMLFETIEQSLQRRVPGEFELVLDDPRRALTLVSRTPDAGTAIALATWSTLVAVYQAVLHDVVQALGDSGRHGLRRVLRARVPRARRPTTPDAR